MEGMAKGDDRNAFPQPGRDTYDRPVAMPGMTLREWYAGQALTGLIAYGVYAGKPDVDLAAAAIAVADAMILRLKE